jgi:two-component system, OmpR family, sensor kinase
MPLLLQNHRLFWKLCLALVVSMALSIAGTVSYFTLNGLQHIPRVEGEPVIGPIPLIPVLSSLIAIFFVSLVLAWYLMRPVSHLRWALRSVAEGHLETRVRPLIRGQRDEIADLAHEFDGMAARLQSAVESQRQLMHDLSHELRSPLSRLEVAIGLIRQNPQCTEDMLKRIEIESSRLDALIEQLLTLYRLEADVQPLPRERLDLIELLRTIAEDAGFEAQLSGQQVKLTAHGSFIANVQGELIYRAFENVIRNAMKFSPPNTEIAIDVELVDGDLQVTVSDQGKGVPEEVLESIFQPFFRHDEIGAKPGAGLGMV